MKITVLVDNIVPFTQIPFLGEHGLALLAEADSKKILVDTGYSEAVLHNMSLLGFHPAQVDAVAISHGHFDHTGGLLPVLRNCRKTLPVYAHPDLFGQRYFRHSAEKKVYIGVPYEKNDLESWGAKWRFSATPVEIAPNLWFSGEIPRRNNFEAIDPKFIYHDLDGQERPDPIADDTVLYYASEKGLVVISGCAHSGLVNVVEHGLAVTGQKKLHGWIGGTHLGPVPEAQRKTTLDWLEKCSPEFLAANHCTGSDMLGKLKARFGRRFIAAGVGTVIEC